MIIIAFINKCQSKVMTTNYFLIESKIIFKNIIIDIWVVHTGVPTC